MPTQIFISHITEDSAVAARLKLRMTEDFLGQLTVFLSVEYGRVLRQERNGSHP